MRTIILEPVDNGIIKTVTDDNYNGDNKLFEEKKIYLLRDNIEDSETFLRGLISDLGLFLGNDYDKCCIHINKSYGTKYQLNHNELMEERKHLTNRLNKLKSLSSHTLLEKNEPASH